MPVVQHACIACWFEIGTCTARVFGLSGMFVLLSLKGVSFVQGIRQQAMVAYVPIQLTSHQQCLVGHLVLLTL